MITEDLDRLLSWRAAVEERKIIFSRGGWGEKGVDAAALLISVLTTAPTVLPDCNLKSVGEASKSPLSNSLFFQPNIVK